MSKVRIDQKEIEFEDICLATDIMKKLDQEESTFILDLLVNYSMALGFCKGVMSVIEEDEK